MKIKWQMIRLKSLLGVGVFFLVLHATAQPFIQEIRNFKKQDSIQPPAKHGILFVGSSSFRKWDSLVQDFPGYPVINRGFGGSTLPDVIRYAEGIIFPYQPRQVVIYCGDNDLAFSDTVTAETVNMRFQRLFGMIRDHLPDASVLFVSIKPSPSRIKLMQKMEEANRLIKDFLDTKSNTGFVDVYHQMLTPEGSPLPDIFLGDKLHMNRKGYEIWKQAIQPYLLK